MDNKKTFAYGFLIAFVLLTYYLYQNNDAIALLIANDGLQGMFWYFVSNASYVLLLFSIIIINTDTGVGVFRNIGGGLMLIYAFDIVSYPRFSPVGLTQDAIMLASSDALFINKLMKLGFDYSSVYTMYYLVLPIVLVGLSVWILGINDFVKKIFKGN